MPDHLGESVGPQNYDLIEGDAIGRWFDENDDEDEDDGEDAIETTAESIEELG